MKTFPVLHRLALRVVATPPSSCSSKRYFSYLKDLFSSKWSRLTDDLINDLTFLRLAWYNNCLVYCALPAPRVPVLQNSYVGPAAELLQAQFAWGLDMHLSAWMLFANSTVLFAELLLQ